MRYTIRCVALCCTIRYIIPVQVVPKVVPDFVGVKLLVDQLRSKLGPGVVVLGAASAEGKVSLIGGVTKDLTGKVQTGMIVGLLAAMDWR